MEAMSYERLAQRQCELGEELAALRACLQACGVLRPQQFLAKLHRLRFEELLARAPCVFTGSLELCMQSPELVLQVAGLLGHAEAVAMSECSIGLRSCLRSVSLELNELFPQQALVLGGVDENAEAMASVESFDITTNSWTELPKLRAPRWSCAAAAAAGRIFVLGGRNIDGEVLGTVETYNMRRGRWEHAPQLHFPRCEAAATMCRGMLFAAGGVAEDEMPLGETEFLRLRNFEIGEWLRAPPRPAWRAAAAVALGDEFFLLGGWDDRAGQPSDEVSYLRVNAEDVGFWAQAPKMREPRAGLGATSLLGSIWAVGGCKGQEDIASVERFTPGSDHWEVVTHLEAPRRACCAVSCGSSLLVLGGVQGKGEDVAGLARFDARWGTWCQGAELPSSRRYFAACAVRLVSGETAEDIKCVIC
ncbi:unnamed protein product [Effrenium voratum]|nr:unnamed protein product [Effrenium voratum]